MAAKPDEAGAEGAKPAKSKKMLFIIIGVVVVLLAGGGGAFFFMKKKAADAEAAALAAEEGGAPAATAHAAPAAAHAAAPGTPPVYLPMDNMVVNLADPGGEKVAQVGITLELLDAHSVDVVKGYMPTIRSGVLMLLSQRTAEELLSAEGKKKLIEDILVETSRPWGGGEEDPANSKKKKRAQPVYPVTGVLFSGLIVQ